MTPPPDVAAFVREEVTPRVAAWEREGVFPRQVVARSGLTALWVPAGDGGLGLTYPEGMDVFEALGRGDAALAFTLAMHNGVAATILARGDPVLRERWGGQLVEGRALGGFSLTEPHAGSDVGAIRTRAVEARDGWRVNGHKAWVSLAGEADLFLVVARTGDGPGHRDAAVLVVERGSPGVTFPTVYRKGCAHFLPIGDMVLEDAPATLLVPPGEGMRAALAAIDVSRCDIAAVANGLHAEALDLALRYAAGRRAFERRVLDFQGIQWTLADAATDLEAGRALTRRAASLLGTPEGRVAVAHAKRFGPDAALRAAILASEVLGAYGWLEDHPLVRFVQLAKMLQVVDGTAEIQRVVIARHLVRRAEGLAPLPARETGGG